MANKIIDITAHQLDLFYTFAGMIADSKAYKTYRNEGTTKKPKILSEQDIVLKLMFGHEMGLSMTQSLTGLYNERGRLTLNVDTMMALINASGQMYDYKEKRTKEKCTIWVKRKGVHTPEDDALEFTYTIEDADDMGLTTGVGKFNYDKQPDVMLFKRCASKMARTLFGDIIKGLYIEGELIDGTKEEEPWEGASTDIEEVDDVVYDSSDEQHLEYDENAEKGGIDFKKALENKHANEDESDEQDEDEEEFDPIIDMIKTYNIGITPDRYLDGYKDFGIWCEENIEFESDDDYTLEDYVFEILGKLNYPMYKFVDYDEDDDEEFDNELLPWSPRLDELYKKAILSFIELNEVGVKEPVAEKTDDEETVPIPQDDEDEEISTEDDAVEDEDDDDWEDGDEEDDWEEDDD